MAEGEFSMSEWADLIGKLDERKKKKYLESMRKSAGEAEGPDAFDQLKALKDERKALQDERDKVFEVVSYWLGSPLRTLKSLTGMALQPGEGMDRVGLLEIAKHIGTHVEKFDLDMRNLVWWASYKVRNVRFEPKPLELDKALESAFALVRPKAQKTGVKLKEEAVEGLEVFADAAVLEVALYNVLDNAVKFTKKDGTVRLRAFVESDDVCVQVCDEGIGMSEAKLANVFNPARRATQQGTAGEKGYGYGLPVVKAALELHERPLEVTSLPGGGTCVSFWLPKA